MVLEVYKQTGLGPLDYVSEMAPGNLHTGQYSVMHNTPVNGDDDRNQILSPNNNAGAIIGTNGLGGIAGAAFYWDKENGLTGFDNLIGTATLAIPQQTILPVNALTGAATDTGLPCGPLLAWSADGHQIATQKENDILVYNLEEKRRTHHLKGHRCNIGSLAWSPDGRSLAVGCDDNTLLFWNLATSRPTAEIPLNGGPFLLGFAQDSSALIAGTMKGCRILRAVPYHPAP
jgi:WD40 repeat protein